jgi:hypothetical protein
METTTPQEPIMSITSRITPGKTFRAVLLAAGLAALAAAPAASADAPKGKPLASSAAVIPCYLNGPSVTRSGGLIARASMFCPGASRVTMRITWRRGTVLVGGSAGRGGYNSVSDVAAIGCIRGVVYTPWVTVTATAPNAVPLARNIPGLPTRC